MATLAYSNRISAIPTYERFLANKMTCAKFQIDIVNIFLHLMYFQGFLYSKWSWSADGCNRQEIWSLKNQFWHEKASISLLVQDHYGEGKRISVANESIRRKFVRNRYYVIWSLQPQKCNIIFIEPSIRQKVKKDHLSRKRLLKIALVRRLAQRLIRCGR